MTDQLRPRALLLECKRLIDLAHEGDPNWDPCSDNAFSYAAHFAAKFACDRANALLVLDIGPGVKVEVNGYRATCEIVACSGRINYPKKARAMAAALIKAAAWEEAFGESIANFNWTRRHAVRMCADLDGMNPAQIRA